MSAEWPNEPNPSILLNDWGHNAIVGGGWTDAYDTTGIFTTIVSDATAPLSPNNVLRQRYPQGLVGGNGGGGGNYLQLPSTYPDMYFGFWFKVGSGFQQHPVGTKIAWIHTPGNNYFMTFTGNGPYNLRINWQWADNDPSNAHLGFVGSGYLQSSPTFNNNEWCQIEWYYRPSTSKTSRDGLFYLWMDRVLAASTTQLNTPFLQPSAVSFISVWGGVGSVMAQDSFTYCDHSRVSATSGSAPPPPPPPPQVVLDSITPSNASTTVGGTRQFTIAMSGAMQTATTLFTTSSAPTVATVPSSVTIQQGASTAAVTATGVAVGSTTISTNYNGVTKAATLQVGTSGTTGGGASTYDYTAQFSGVQGQDNWYWLENDGTPMVYEVYTPTVWQGSDLYGGILQTAWDDGFSPGGKRGVIVRFVVPTAGSAHITGAFFDVDTGGGYGVTAYVKHNGVTLFTRVIANGETTGGDYDLTATVAVGDHIDFVVDNTTSDYRWNSTNLDPVIAITPTTTDPAPPLPPEPPTAIVDLFSSSTSALNAVPFTVTVRLSKVVTTDTAVEIRVGSTSILSAASSVTVPSGSSEKAFTITPVGVGQSTIDAVLNGTKRLTITVQPVAPDPQPDPPGDDESIPGEDNPITVLRASVNADGGDITLSRPAALLAFKYDAQPDWAVIPAFTPAGTFVHRFTWPSGTTTVCYRAQTISGVWGPGLCKSLAPPAPPPPLPTVNKAIIDRAGIRWQLTGRKSPYELKRNGSTMDNTYGVMLRKSGDGYMELLQTNGVWLRRNGNAWEFVE